MRRMYSETELTKIIKSVLDAEIAAGDLDDNIAAAVDDYLTENPVDITALEGQDISVASVDADSLITGGEIIEKMSGYSFNSSSVPTGITKEIVYCGACKNGNKLSLVLAVNITRTGDVDGNTLTMGSITIPDAVLANLYPTSIGGGNYLDLQVVQAWAGENTKTAVNAYSTKGVHSVAIYCNSINDVPLNTKSYIRYEVTFMLGAPLNN